MIRHVACLAMALLAGIPLRAGELDTEFGGQTPPVPAVTPATSKTATSESAPLLAATRDVKAGGVKASELDEEMPSQAWRRGFGYGYGGFGGAATATAASAGASATAASAGASASARGFGRGFGLSFGYGGLGFGYGGLGYGYGGFGYGGLGYGGFGYGGLGYGGFGYGGGYLLATSYLGYGYGGFPGCYYW